MTVCPATVSKFLDDLHVANAVGLYPFQCKDFCIMRMFEIKQEPCCGIIIGSSQLVSSDPVVLFHPIDHFQAVGPLFKHATPGNEYLGPVVGKWKTFILDHDDHA